MIAFGTQNFDTADRSMFWRYILAGQYELDMVDGVEVVIMADQKKAADIAGLALDITVYNSE